ncbi:FAD-dependent oxidoreductase [Ideonella sp. DXS29W]|uniref:FAD-dependent oxidoreductase n=1 Tax=Ideonella lacteola TaxID=2984193 RepID=A0ABU9BWQ9_9BURK
MRIAVIGAGLAGVTTAYELARDGHEVVVYERRGGIAAEGSFAPACVAASGLWLAHAAVNAWGGLDALSAPFTGWPWLWRRWNAVRQTQHAMRLTFMRDLAAMTLERLKTIETSCALEYDHHPGVTALMRTPRHAARAQALLAQHQALNLPVKWLDADEVRRAQPGLSAKSPVAGAFHWSGGRTANGRQFAHALKAEAQRLGARFQFHQEVIALQATGAARQPWEVTAQRRSEVSESRSTASALGQTTIVDDGPQNVDAVVLCSTEAATRLLPPALRPTTMRGHVHSVTAPRHQGGEAESILGPTGAVVDPAAGTTITPMGDRLRVAGGAAIGPAPARPLEATLLQLYGALEADFPGATRTARAQPWVGRQAHCVDGLPALGPVQSGLWLHLAHGTSAWAHAPACGRLLADQISGRSPALDTTLISPARLR